MNKQIIVDNLRKNDNTETANDNKRLNNPLNLFKINESEEHQLEEESKTKNENYKDLDFSIFFIYNLEKNNLFKNFEDDKSVEKDENKKILDMKKKLNKFLVDIENEEPDNFPVESHKNIIETKKKDRSEFLNDNNTK